MPCDAETVLASACESRIACLRQQVPLLQVIAQNYLTLISPDDTAEDVLERACESGISCIKSEVSLLQLIATNLCEVITE